MTTDKDDIGNEFDKVDDLIKKLGQSDDPQDRDLSKLIKQTRVNYKKLEEGIHALQESLDYLRICIKYQTFDLEATRRENRYLRTLLEEQNEKGD